MSLYGSSILSPVDCLMMLKGLHAQYVIPGTPPSIDSRIFIFSSGGMLASQASRLRKLHGVVLLLDTVGELDRWEGLQSVDSTDTSSGRLRTMLTTGNYSLIRLPVRRPPRNYVRELLDSADQGVLKAVMSFVYAFKPSHREQVKAETVKWLTTDRPFSDLHSTILAMLRRSTNLQKFSEFERILSSQRVTNIRRVLANATPDMAETPELETLCQEHQVESFEVNYLLKLLSAAH